MIGTDIQSTKSCEYLSPKRQNQQVIHSNFTNCIRLENRLRLY